MVSIWHLNTQEQDADAVDKEAFLSFESNVFWFVDAEIFGSVSKNWGHVDVGVIVCGPPTLQSSVAKEIRSHNLRRQWNHPIFHFNSHSFDL